MSLQGTFDTLPVTELLGLLVRARKTGVLRLETESAEGRLWLVSGRCRAVESGEQTGPTGTPGELQERLADACFAAAHQETGSFRFADGEEPPWPTAYDVAVEDAVAEVHRRLDEWEAIRRVVPSLDHRPRLRPELAGSPITLDAEQWRLLVALDGRRSVRDVVHRTERSVLDVCRAVKDLVERGAVEVAGAEPVPVEPVPVEPVPVEAGSAEMKIAGLEGLAELAGIAGIAGAGAAPGVAEPAPTGSARERDAADPRETPESAATRATRVPQIPQRPEIGQLAVARAVDEGEALVPVEPVAGRLGAALAPAAATVTLPVGSAAGGALPSELPAGPPGEEAVRDRGALLRLFSALRDS